MKIRKKKKIRSQKAGLPPGSLVLVGEKSIEKAIVKVTRYTADECAESIPTSVNDICPVDDGTITWVAVHGLHDPEVIRSIGEKFNIHPLTLEDIMNTDHRPKFDNHKDYIFIVFKHFTTDPKTKWDITPRQFSLIIGKDYVISFQETMDEIFSSIHTRLLVNLERYWKMGPGFLAYSLMDIVIDNYFSILEIFDDAIDDLEDSSTLDNVPDTLKNLQLLRREIITMRKSVWPLREVLASIQKRESHLIAEEAVVYFMDVYDHVIQIMDTTETFREVLSNIFDIYLSSTNNRMNEIMKVLTIIATIMLPMSFIASLYGMNFKYMPELSWRVGYPMALLMMASVVVGMLSFFRKKKWL